MASPEWPAALRRAALCCWANSLERPPGFAETPGSQLGLPALPLAISFMLHRVLLTPRPPGFAETPGSQLGLPALPMAISFMLHRVLLTLHWATAALASKGLGAASL